MATLYLGLGGRIFKILIKICIFAENLVHTVSRPRYEYPAVDLAGRDGTKGIVWRSSPSSTDSGRR